MADQKLQDLTEYTTVLSTYLTPVSDAATGRLRKATVANLLASGNFAADADVLKKDGTVELTANWDAGGFEIRAQTFRSDVPTGTAPFTIASATLVANLNADQVDGIEGAEILQRGGTVELTANWDAGSFQIQAETFRSDVATGTAPLVVASTTLVTNLNADLLDGIQAAEFLKRDGSVALTSAWDAGSFQIRAETFNADVADGTPPFVVTSTTLVDNLNADTVDGIEGAEIIQRDGSVNFTGNQSMNSNRLTGVGTPSADTDAATKGYVDAAIEGLKPKGTVRVATTANITLSGEQTVDGVLTSGDRILVKDQSTGSENGIYVTASSSWSRSNDMAAGSSAAGAHMFVEEGTSHGDTQFVCTTNAGSDTVGTDSLAFASYGTGGGGGESNTASNVGSDGVGVFKQKSGVNLEFKHVAPGSGKITVTASGDDIDIDIGTLPVDDLSNVSITSVASGEVLKFNGSIWINNTLAEAGIAAATHTHTESDITDLGSYIENVSEDTTPQLGGDLDCNGHTVHFGTAENKQTPTGTTATIDLSAENHHMLDTSSASGGVTLTINGPPGPTAGTLLISQGGTARDITFSAGTAINTITWLGTEPTWNGDTNKVRVISWRYTPESNVLYLMASETD